MPFITNEAFDSPGCTRDVIMIDLRMAMSTGSLVKFVTISMSTSLPASDLHKTVFLILSLFANVQTLLMKLHQLFCENHNQTL